MKPMGPIPPAFAMPGGLVIAGRPVEDWAGTTPAFVYDLDLIAARVARLRAALPAAIDIHYAIKANPLPGLLKRVSQIVDGLDVASAGELERALAVKPASAISFAGPGKRDVELAAAIHAGATLNAESEGEVSRAIAIGERLGITPRLAVRVNPDFELKGSGMKMATRASPFGVDAIRVPALVRRIIDSGADWRGFHIFAGSQSLDTGAIIDAQRETLLLAERLSREIGANPPLVNLGGGMGVPYFANDTAVDAEAIGAALADRLEQLPADVFGEAQFAIELGRWLVAEAGVYLTRVIDRKESGGEIFLVVDGGLHHQLATTGNFGTVVRRNYPVALAHDVMASPVETVSIVGPLCTPLDRLADRIGFPHAQPGDLVAVFLAGAYGATASPSAFLGHPPATEHVGP